MVYSLSTTKQEREIGDFLFRIGMYWRIVYGFLRLVVATLLIQKIGTPVSQVLYSVWSGEQSEDPRDVFLNFFSSILGHFPYHVTYFLVSYLVFWGLVDIVLSISLLKHKLWAFPVTLSLIGLFVIYEIYRFFHTHSLLLLWIIIVDFVLMWLIRNEYRNLKS